MTILANFKLKMAIFSNFYLATLIKTVLITNIRDSSDYVFSDILEELMPNIANHHW
jgi:hypothetical protein